MHAANTEQQEKRNALFFALGNEISQARRLVALNRFEASKPHQIIIDENLINGVQALIGPTLLLDEQLSGSTTIDIKISNYKKSLSEWLVSLANQLNNEKPSYSVIPNTVVFTYQMKNESNESSLPIGYVDWIHTLDERLLELDRLLKRKINQPVIEFNESGREML